MTKPQQPQQKIPMLQQSSLVFDCFSLLVTCTSFFFCSSKCCHIDNLVVTCGCQYYCKKDGKTRIPPRQQNLIIVSIVFCANTTRTTAKNKEMMTPPRTQKPTCFYKIHKG